MKNRKNCEATPVGHPSMKFKQLSEKEKNEITCLTDIGMSARFIAKKLRRSHSTILRWVKRYKLTGLAERAKGSGRPSKLSERTSRAICRTILKERETTLEDLQHYISWDSVCTRTLSEVIHANLNIFSGWKTKKPFINAVNRKKRLAFCNKYKNWTAEDWERVIFTDESPFKLRFAGRLRVWKLVGERGNPQTMTGTVKHDGKINVSGGFTAFGVTPLVKIDGKMDRFQYKKILSKKLLPAAKQIFKQNEVEDWIFQQDNDPKHTSKLIKRYLANKKINVLDWPSQSPDLNPIENLWSILDLECRKRQCSNEEELLETLRVAWEKLDTGLLKKLVHSMPSRIQECIKANGFPTRY